MAGGGLARCGLRLLSRQQLTGFCSPHRPGSWSQDLYSPALIAGLALWGGEWGAAEAGSGPARFTKLLPDVKVLELP